MVEEKDRGSSEDGQSSEAKGRSEISSVHLGAMRSPVWLPYFSHEVTSILTRIWAMEMEGNGTAMD